MAGYPSSGPGAYRVAPGTLTLNAGAETKTLVIENTGDRPIQIGSHLHLPDANSALSFDRAAARGFRLDIPAGTSRRFEPGASREVTIVALGGARLVPGLQIRPPAVEQTHPPAVEQTHPPAVEQTHPPAVELVETPEA